MASVVWTLWGVFEEDLQTFETHVLAPEAWTEGDVLSAAIAAYEQRGDEEAIDTARMLRQSGQATPLLGTTGRRHALEVAYDPEARPHRLRIVEAWDDVELHLGGA